jgi:hypothetical protein
MWLCLRKHRAVMLSPSTNNPESNDFTSKSLYNFYLSLSIVHLRALSSTAPYIVPAGAIPK